MYNLTFGKSLDDKTELNLGNLICYVGEVAYQNQLATNKTSKQLPTFYAIRLHSTDPLNSTYWPTLGIFGDNLLVDYTLLHEMLNNKFEKVTLSKEVAKSIFGINASEHNHMAYYQSKDVLTGNSLDDLNKASISKIKSALGMHIYPTYYDDQFDFYITLPLEKENLEPMNEFTAVYVITHFLSELVRYRPHELENLLKSKEAWVLESFVESSASIFLRGIVPIITNKDYRILHR